MASSPRDAVIRQGRSDQDASKSPAHSGRAAPRLGGMIEIEVTAVDNSAIPVEHSVVAIGQDGEQVATVTGTGFLLAGGGSLSVGSRGFAVRRQDGRWMIQTQGGGTAALLAHSHTGGTDMPPIGINA